MHTPHLEYIPTIDSTNLELKRRWLASHTGPIAISAKQQTAGKGRLDRQWQSPEGGLYYSAMVPIGELPPVAFGFLAGLAAHKALITHHPSIALKWPNDILGTPNQANREHKLGGILSALLTDNSRPSCVVVGIGLNINTDIVLPPEGTHLPPTSLRDLTHQPQSITDIAHTLHQHFFALCQRLIQTTEPLTERLHQLQQEWSDVASTIGREVTILRHAQTIRGTAIGLADSFALRLAVEGGRVEDINAGDCLHLR